MMKRKTTLNPTGLCGEPPSFEGDSTALPLYAAREARQAQAPARRNTTWCGFVPHGPWKGLEIPEGAVGIGPSRRKWQWSSDHGIDCTHILGQRPRASVRDLLTPEERIDMQTPHLRFDSPRLPSA